MTIEVVAIIVESLLTLSVGSWLVRDWIQHCRRPKLKLIVRENWAEVRREPSDEVRARSDAPYEVEYHLFVENVGKQTAIECEGLLDRVEEKTGSGWHEDPNFYATPASLEWAYTAGARTVAIPPNDAGASRRLAVFGLTNQDEEIHIAQVGPDVERDTRIGGLEAWEYRFTITVHCENGDSDTCVLAVTRTGGLGVDVEQVPQAGGRDDD